MADDLTTIVLYFESRFSLIYLEYFFNSMFAYTSIKRKDKKNLVDRTMLSVTVVKFLQTSVAVVKSSFKFSLGKADFDMFTINAFNKY